MLLPIHDTRPTVSCDMGHHHTCMYWKVALFENNASNLLSHSVKRSNPGIFRKNNNSIIVEIATTGVPSIMCYLVCTSNCN